MIRIVLSSVLALSVVAFPTTSLAQPSQKVTSNQGGVNVDPPAMGIQAYQVGRYGQFVTYVESGTPAERLGLEPGDIITHINGRPIRSEWSYQMALTDAMDYRGGVVTVRIDDVRARKGGYRRYVTKRTTLDGPIALKTVR